MPAYSTQGPGFAVGLAPGQQQTLINAVDAVAGNVTATNAVGLGQIAGCTPTITLINTTGQTATVAVSASDASQASYIALKNADTTNAITVAANSAITFTCAAPFLLCTFASAPSTGTLVICR